MGYARRQLIRTSENRAIHAIRCLLPLAQNVLLLLTRLDDARAVAPHLVVVAHGRARDVPADRGDPSFLALR